MWFDCVVCWHQTNSFRKERRSTKSTKRRADSHSRKFASQGPARRVRLPFDSTLKIYEILNGPAYFSFVAETALPMEMLDRRNSLPREFIGCFLLLGVLAIGSVRMLRPESDTMAPVIPVSAHLGLLFAAG